MTNHKRVSQNFEEIAPVFTQCNLVDNTNGPKVIAKCSEGGKVEILDKKAYRQFISKSYYNEYEELSKFRDKLKEYRKEYIAKNKGAKNLPKDPIDQIDALLKMYKK